VIYGCDLSPEYQPGFDVDTAYDAGCRFLAVKLSDGTKGYDRYEEGIDVLDAARFGHRMVGIGYHFVRPDVSAVDQAVMFARQLKRAGDAPGMLDIESGDAKALDLVREIHLNLVRDLGCRVAFTYLPRWWWGSIGSPSLAGLPTIWASRYVSNAGVEVEGSPQQIAQGITPTSWETYGGKSLSVLQFTRKAKIGRYVMDADAFVGTLADLEVMAYGRDGRP
jgi:hypothetical protein